VFENKGWNLTPLDLQGAIGCIQVDKLDEILARKKISHDIISDIFKKYILDIRIPETLFQANTAWFGTPFICASKEQKQKLVKYLENNKIQTRNFFAGNVLMHPGYSDLGDYKDYPISNIIYDKVLFIGASPHYSEKIFEYINDVLEKFKND
jgi:CDP-6-deoxy-D-xylo-4-hexulose-3-dehydrase